MKNSNVFSLSDSVVVLAGANGLIGRSIAEVVQSQGAKLVALDFGWEPNSEQGRFNVDLTNEIAISDFFSFVAKEYSSTRSWGFVNATYPHTPNWRTLQFENFSMVEWNKNVEIHLGSAFCFSQKSVALVQALKGTGSIVNFGSIYGELGPDLSIYKDTPMLNPIAYAAIKGGISSLTRWIATSFGTKGIRANTIAPGGVENKQPAPFIEAYKRRCPMGRMGTPEDMAGVVSFLLSPAAKYVNGQTLLVDGGWSAW